MRVYVIGYNILMGRQCWRDAAAGTPGPQTCWRWQCHFQSQKGSSPCFKWQAGLRIRADVSLVDTTSYRFRIRWMQNPWAEAVWRAGASWLWNLLRESFVLAAACLWRLSLRSRLLLNQNVAAAGVNRLASTTYMMLSPLCKPPRNLSSSYVTCHSVTIWRIRQ